MKISYRSYNLHLENLTKMGKIRIRLVEKRTYPGVFRSVLLESSPSLELSILGTCPCIYCVHSRTNRDRRFDLHLKVAEDRRLTDREIQV